MTPYELVCSKFKFPFNLYPFQQVGCNDLADLPRQALYMDPGTGKTATSTHIALYKMVRYGYDTTLVLGPPLLVDMWSKWLSLIKCSEGDPLNVTVYQGTPKERAKIQLGRGFIVMSLDIFKRDFQRISAALSDRNVVLIVDECQSLKDISTANHKSVHDFLHGDNREFIGLTGTPISTPIDAYAHCKLRAPGLYRNMKHFENVHVESWDIWRKPEKFMNLELLASNMKVNAVRVLKEEVLSQLPPATYQPMYYKLAPAHQKLYEKIAEEQLVKLEQGGKLDLTSAGALRHALEQIVMNPAHFAQDESLEPNGWQILEEVMGQLGDKKLICFANYRMTNRNLVAKYKQKYGAVAVYGDVPNKEKSANIARFISDPACRLLIGEPRALGVGVDGAQHVCSDVLYLEMPGAVLLNQSMSRVYRDGQKSAVTVRVAVAEGTLQPRRYKNLLENDELITVVAGGWKSLRDYIYGM